MPRSARQIGVLILLLLLNVSTALASGGDADTAIRLDFTTSLAGMVALSAFVIAYGFVISEEFLHLRKSKPVLIAAGLIWVLVAIAYSNAGHPAVASAAVKHNLLEYAELMLFLLSAMTFINTMDERNVFRALRAWLVSAGFSLPMIFWITGLLAFFISPVADNLTTALLMAAVVMAVAGKNQKFVVLACINVVVAANAGGAFSPFGDITTLMVWQKGVVHFNQFFSLFLPSLINWLVPAFFMSLAVEKGQPEPLREKVEIKYGGLIVVGLFMTTISLTVLMHNFLHLPPFLGMMTGLGLLKVYGYFIRRNDVVKASPDGSLDISAFNLEGKVKPATKPFDIFISMKRAEWDTLMFFYGVVLCVGGLGTLGYLSMLSHLMYEGLGPTWANILVGLLSSIVDNIPVMFAVLSMDPAMPLQQWLLVTLTAGVGGSLLSIGSAAGVALMGQARGSYTFFAHLRWSWAIALGYAASIAVHLWLN